MGDMSHHYFPIGWNKTGVEKRFSWVDPIDTAPRGAVPSLWLSLLIPALHMLPPEPFPTTTFLENTGNIYSVEPIAFYTIVPVGRRILILSPLQLPHRKYRYSSK